MGQMDQKVRTAIYRAVENEPFVRALNMELVELELGYSAVEMTYDPSTMSNIYDRAHGGAIFGLIDEAFGRLIATCQALAYRTGKPIPFL